VKQTLAVNDCCCPSDTVAAEGETLMGVAHAAVIVIDDAAVWVESAALVATTVTGFTGGSDAGAV
jgi:hypothetical protein